MKEICKDILNAVFTTKTIGKKQLYDSIPIVLKMSEKLVKITKKGILKNKLLKKELDHKDMLVILRHLAKADDKYILYKRHSVKQNNKWKTAYAYRLTN
jgi:hypothetical protein